MKELHRENKGFSLVELIVVVLILGILAVAVSPQVMKWVGKSRISADLANAKELKYGMQTVLADWQGRGGINHETQDFLLEIDKNGNVKSSTLEDWTDGSATETLSEVLDETMAGVYPKVQHEVLTGTDVGFRITIEKVTGKITVDCEAMNVTG